MNPRIRRVAVQFLVCVLIAAASAFVIDALDRHRDVLAGAVLFPLAWVWVALLRKAWRQRAYLLLGAVACAPLLGVLAWGVIALQAALAAA